MITAASKPRFLVFSHNGVSSHHKFPKIFAYPKVTMNSKSLQSQKKEEPWVEQPKLLAPKLKKPGPSKLEFDRLQPSDQECIEESEMQFGMEFGQLVAREAVLDEEYWTAAWLRAETKWENQASRYLQNHKIQFADQEFNALKRRCKGQGVRKCNCIIMVRKSEKNVKRTVIKSVVGTLDLSIRYLLHGETFPGERQKAAAFCTVNRAERGRYGYIANLCVAKFARRRGIASNMLHFALEFARTTGLEDVFVHVSRINTVAMELYQKMGFEIVEVATPQLSEEQTYLLSLKL